MIRISLSWLAEQFILIDKIDSMNNDIGSIDNSFIILDAKHSLESLGNSVYIRFLKVSRKSISDLLEKLNSLEMKEHFLYNLTEYDIIDIKSRSQNLKKILTEEFGITPAYIPTAKGMFDIELLYSNGKDLFGEDLESFSLESKADAIEAARCLAFDLPTAAAYHTFRVIESVLRRYAKIANNNKVVNQKTIGAIAKFLIDNEIGDLKINESIRQIGSLHRNPIIHPEIHLSIEESIEIIGIARSVISAMLRYIRKYP
jgi:hypothetical protein